MEKILNNYKGNLKESDWKLEKLLKFEEIFIMNVRLILRNNFGNFELIGGKIDKNFLEKLVKICKTF